MNTVIGAVFGLFTYAEFAAILAAYLPCAWASRLLHRNDKTFRHPGRWVRRLGRHASGISPLWDFCVEGEGPSDILTKPYVVVANHESTADPFLLSHFPWDMRWVAKEELFKTPLTGWILSAGGDIRLRRGSGASVRKMLDECRESLRAGIPVMIFPEGTRSRDGELLPFKDGAFQLAIEAQVPILPIALFGTRDCRPKGSRWFGKASATARVLPAVSTEGLTTRDVAALRDSVRSCIASGVADLRIKHARSSTPPPVGNERAEKKAEAEIHEFRVN